jgi:hypothetical protein
MGLIDSGHPVSPSHTLPKPFFAGRRSTSTPANPTRKIAAKVQSPRSDLDVGPADTNNNAALRAARNDRHCQGVATGDYGGIALSTYVEYEWFNAAANEEHAHLREAFDTLLILPTTMSIKPRSCRVPGKIPEAIFVEDRGEEGAVGRQ